METVMTGAADAQASTAFYIGVGGVALGVAAALVFGFLLGDWITAPLRDSAQGEEHRQRVCEQRERRTCLAVALLCYYAPALTVVGLHSGLAGFIPYLRAHLLDGFGCAALFALALAPLRQPLAEASRQYKPGFEEVGRAGRASLLLVGGSVAIAASAAWIAGGSWPDAFLAGVCAYVPLQFFWGLVALRISAAPLEALAPPG
jgi:hypothetical protein